MGTVYIVGHKNPDTDAICSAYAYAELKNELATRSRKTSHGDAQSDAHGDTHTYVPIRCGEMTLQTQYVFDKFGVEYIEKRMEVYPRVGDAMTPLSKLSTLLHDEPVIRFGALSATDTKRYYPVVDAVNGKYLGVVGLKEFAELLLSTSLLERKHSLAFSYYDDILEGKCLREGSGGSAYSIHMSFLNATKEQASSRVVVADYRIASDHWSDLHPYGAVVVSSFSDEHHSIDVTPFQGWVFTTPLSKEDTFKRLLMTIPSGEVAAPLDSVSVTDYLYAAEKTLRDKQLQSIAVVGGSSNLVGMLSRADVMSSMEGSMGSEKIILVDHNEPTHAIEGSHSAEILEIVDHHKLNTFKTDMPIKVHMKPLGSTCSIVYELYKRHGIEPSRETAGLMLSAILTDTLVGKSPTCTPTDIVYMAELGAIAGVDYRQYGIEIFTETAGLKTKTASQIILDDYKIFHEHGVKIGIGQCEIVDINEVFPVEGDILTELQRIADDDELDWVMVLVTDILLEESYLYSSNFQVGETLLEYKLDGSHKYHCPGVLSRKKQLTPEVMRVIRSIHA